MVGYYNQGAQGVPTNADLENNSNQKKYTVNRPAGKSLVISKPLCTLMAIGAILLAVLVGLVVFFLVPRGCIGSESGSPVASLTKHSGKLQNNPDNEVNERLPRSIKPLNYMIQIQPDFENSTTYGVETITLVPTEDTDTIIFHVNKIDIHKHSVLVRAADKTNTTESIPISSQDYLDGQRYKIVLEEQLNKDKPYVLNLEFQGKLNNQLQGFYKSQYTSPTGENRFAASTQFSPTDARRAFPCFDEPAFKARFKLRLARPSNMSTLSNMPLSKTDPFQTSDGRWFWDEYPETPEMPTYLVTFIVSELAELQAADIIKIWGRREFSSQVQYPITIAPKILRYFENYFRINYPLPKIDIVAVPEFGFSAMENWGLITFRESSLLFDPTSSTVDDKRTIATVLSHEIVHQWFGNLVTPKWWNDLWLKEGFATYLEYLGVDQAEPSWKILEEFLLSETERAMAFDSLESSRPISFEVYNSVQIRQAFDEISYAKGACIIRMMNHFLGEDTFKNGLIKYLEKYKFSNADRNDLFQSLTEEAHMRGSLQANETVKHIMDTWTEQAGFPVVHVAADYTKNTLRIIQKRFLLTDTSSNDKSKWWIPISYTSSVSADFENTGPKFWMRGENEIVEYVGPIGDWYLLNLNQTGYYIVNYDEHNWKQLIDKIMVFPPLIRAQLISDSMDLARANQLDYEIAFKLIARMAIQDVNIMFVPTAVAFSKLQFLGDILYNTPSYGLFEEFHKTIFKNTYEIVDFNDNIDDYLTRRIRQTVLDWSCKSSESRCVHQSRSLFRNWMIDGKSVLPNLRSVVYCTAIREGSDIEWNFAYEKYLETTSPTEKNILLDSLGCTKLKWLLSRYLDKLIDGYSIRIQDADRVFESVAKNKEGTMIAFDFIRTHWDELAEHYGDGFNILGRMVQSLAVHMTTEFQLTELERFKDSVKDNISSTMQAFDSAIERVKGNVEWMKKNYKQVEDWLTKHQDQFLYI